jgi:hypothetical protein
LERPSYESSQPPVDPAWTANGNDYHDPKDNGRGLINYCAWNKGYAELRIANGGNPKIKIVNLAK